MSIAELTPDQIVEGLADSIPLRYSERNMKITCIFCKHEWNMRDIVDARNHWEHGGMCLWHQAKQLQFLARMAEERGQAERDREI